MEHSRAYRDLGLGGLHGSQWHLLVQLVPRRHRGNLRLSAVHHTLSLLLHAWTQLLTVLCVPEGTLHAWTHLQQVWCAPKCALGTWTHLLHVWCIPKCALRTCRKGSRVNAHRS